MNQRLIAYYINSLSVSDAMRLARNYEVDLSEEETRIILPFLKKHRYELKVDNKETLLAEIKKEVTEVTYLKIETVLNQFIK